ncbi:MAG: hypothetical protein HY646_19715, partial [Acidobacteria bacterium]|nr:hypothetical protein [Acidobacteriota bacterium]
MSKWLIPALVHTALLLSFLYAQTGRPPRPPKPGVKTPGVQIPMSLLKPEAVFEIPGTPDWIVIDEHVWVSNRPRNTVARIDPKTNTIAATIEAGKSPCSGIAAGFGSVWVPNCGDQTLSRIDIKTGKVAATIPIGVGDSEGGLATGAGSVWIMTDRKGTLARLDPATNKVVAEIQVPSGSYAVAFGEGAVWVTSTENNVLTRVDPQTNLVVESIPVGKAPR